MGSSIATSLANPTVIEEVEDHPLHKITMDEAYIAAGGWGRFQYFMMITTILAMNSAGFVLYGVAYMELEP